MNNEVEEFLRRAAQRRAQVEAQLRAQAEARAKGQAPQPPQRSQPPKRLTPASQSISQQQAHTRAEVVEPARDEGLGNRVAASVVEHMRHTQEIGAQVELLGDRVEIADEAMAAHLQQTFDHQLGSLRTSADMPTLTAGVSPSVAAMVVRDTSPAHAIAELLRTPQNVRNAVVIAEVLNRPTDRW